MTNLEIIRMKYKWEIWVMFLLILALVIFFIRASYIPTNHKFTSGVWTVLYALGYQLIYGIGIGLLFSRASVKYFSIGFLFHLILLILVWNFPLFRPPGLSFYCLIFASLAMLAVGIARIIKWGIKRLKK